MATYLPAKLAKILAVLTDFHLLNLLPQTSTISGAVFPNNTSLLCSLRLQDIRNIKLNNKMTKRKKITVTSPKAFFAQTKDSKRNLG